MDLKSWLKQSQYTNAKFAKKIKTAPMTVYNIINGNDLYFATACRIVDATHGEVSFIDLLPNELPKGMRTRLRSINKTSNNISDDYSEEECENQD